MTSTRPRTAVVIVIAAEDIDDAGAACPCNPAAPALSIAAQSIAAQSKLLLWLIVDASS